MQTYLLADLQGLPALTVGRRTRALERLLEVAKDVAGAGPVEALVPAALAAQRNCTNVLKAWYQARKDEAMHETGARELHFSVGRAVSMLYSTVDGMRETAPPELASLAREIVVTQFPNGVGGNTQLPWIDQYHDVTSILGHLTSAAFADHRAKLGLEPQLALLGQLTAQFGERLVKSERVTYAMALAAETDARGAFAVVYAAVCATFATDAPADVEARRRLLQPWFDQVASVAALRAARRAGAAEGDAPETPVVGQEPSTEAAFAEAIDELEAEKAA